MIGVEKRKNKTNANVYHLHKYPVKYPHVIFFSFFLCLGTHSQNIFAKFYRKGGEGWEM